MDHNISKDTFGGGFYRIKKYMDNLTTSGFITTSGTTSSNFIWSSPNVVKEKTKKTIKERHTKIICLL